MLRAMSLHQHKTETQDSTGFKIQARKSSQLAHFG
jgi:hypothetical protein